MRNRLHRIVTFDLQAYRNLHDFSRLKENHVPFSGFLLKHPHDSEKVILVADPHGSNPVYYEFRMDDISSLEKLPNIVKLDGKTIHLARLWVKKRSIGIKCTPFMVNDVRRYELGR